MLEEFARDVFIRLIVWRQLDSDAQHGEAIHPHPGGTVRLFQKSARRQWLRPVKDADIVEAQESAFEDVVAANPCDSPTR